MSSTWHCDEPVDGVLSVLIDRKDKPVNALGHQTLEELDELMARVRRDPSVRGVVFRSGKPGTFIAGADLDELSQLGGAEPAEALSRLGHRVFAALADLPVPTVALISGACLGGGLEFALACTYRVADDDRRTRLGLPEVNLGLVPGWGGTVRLPRLIGLTAALPMILTGRLMSGRQAKRLGLVHDVVPTEALDQVGQQIVRRHAEQNASSAAAVPSQTRAVLKPTAPSRLRRLVLENAVAYRLTLQAAERQVLRKSGGHYPAPLRAVEVLRAGLLEGPAAGFEAETAAIRQLAEHPVTRELMRLFFLREEGKKPPAELARHPAADPDRLRQVAVIGAGAMGAGIAALLVDRGLRVRLKDLNPEAVGRGLKKVHDALAAQVRRGPISRLAARDALDRLSPATDYAGLKNADIAIEAVVEDLDVKRHVFQELAEATGPQTVLATNTSSLLVADIAASVPHPERVVGLHFFNPPHRMPLVEVVRTERTSPEALAKALALVQRLGKTKVIVGDCAGFLVNRVLGPYLNEAGYLLCELPEPMELERAAVQFGMPMGPLELTDLVGIEVAAHVAENLHQAYGQRMAPAPAWGQLLAVCRQRTGRGRRLVQTGWGGKRLSRAAARCIARLRKQQAGPAAAGGRAADQAAIVQRLIYPMINEAARCLEEQVVQTAAEVDLGMVFGTGFAPFRGGLLRFADSIGISSIVAALDQLAPQHPRLAPCEPLRRLAAQGSGFYDAYAAGSTNAR